MATLDDQETHPSNGDFALLYDRLRSVARHLLSREAPNHTLQATALVHEAYLKLAKTWPVEMVNDSQHLRALIITAMRQVLVDHARSRNAIKRCGHLKAILPGDAIAMSEGDPLTFLAVEEALAKLQRTDPEKATIFELRFILGFSRSEMARDLDLPVERVKNALEFASAWIRRELSATLGRPQG